MAKKSNNNSPVYLTKRTLVNAARTIGRKASSRAMDSMGYIITSENGWIVKKTADGHVEAIKRIEPIAIENENQEVALD
jgi:hypothetical protein